MKIFAVDTSAKSASAAIVEDGIIKGEFFINTMLTHSETLMPITVLLHDHVLLLHRRRRLISATRSKERT